MASDAVRGGEQSLSPALAVRGLVISPPLVMAPMAGLTHPAFRRLVAEIGGAGLYYTEMLSARALRHERPGRSRFFSTRADAAPLCLQVFASRPEEIPPAVESGAEWSPDAWDLNLGCPAPAVRKQGAGAALLKRPREAQMLVRAMRREVSGPLFCKIRAGESPERTAGTARLLQDAGADALVLHARGAAEKFGRRARWEHIAAAAAAVTIPVIGNGDVTEPEDAGRMMRQTGCRGVMIGRAAVRRPWLFAAAAGSLGVPVPPPAFRRRSSIFARLVELIREELSPPRDQRRLAEFTRYFAGDFAFGHLLWKAVHNAPDLDTAASRAYDFFKRHEKQDGINC